MDKDLEATNQRLEEIIAALTAEIETLKKGQEKTCPDCKLTAHPFHKKNCPTCKGTGRVSGAELGEVSDGQPQTLP